MKEGRDPAIDIIKFFAVLLITWSHFEAPLGRFSSLATGGAFGNSLFFFISGYTLLLSNRNTGFLNWYKQRINRIYPTVFAWALVIAVFYNVNYNMKDIVFHGGGLFISCIMVFYILFYPIKRLVSTKYIWLVGLVYFFLHAISYFLIDKTNACVLHSWQWSGYFLSMLAGALIGRKMKEANRSRIYDANKWLILLGLLSSVALYYFLMYIERTYTSFVVINIIPLIGFATFSYCICCRSFPNSLYGNKIGYWIIRFVGGLCLEVYLVQPRIISDRLNSLFPLNLIVIFLLIILAAFFLRCLARIWAQTFKDEDYNWREVLKPF